MMHCLSEIEMKRNMIFFSTDTSYLSWVGMQGLSTKKCKQLLDKKTQLKNVKSLVLYVGHKVLFSIDGQWALTSKLMPLARHVTFQ